MSNRKVTKTYQELKDMLTEEQYRVTQEKATEAPYSGRYWDSKDSGMYQCVVCGIELFSSNTKFDSSSGWPSFYKPAKNDNVELHEDTSHGMIRTEVVCKNCGAHLGHVFDDGPKENGGKRFCINSCALDLQKS